MSQTTDNNGTSGIRRRLGWRQFRLSTLLIFSTVVGSLLGWVARERARCAQGEDVIRHVVRHGGWVRFDQSRLTRPAWLRVVLGDNSFEAVEAIGLEGAAINNQAMSRIPVCTHLQELFLYNTQVSKSECVRLRRELPNLRIVAKSQDEPIGDSLGCCAADGHHQHFET